MIGKLFANEGANAALVLAFSGTIAALVAHGPGRLSFGRALPGVLSNLIPRHLLSGVREGLQVSERRAAA